MGLLKENDNHGPFLVWKDNKREEYKVEPKPKFPQILKPSWAESGTRLCRSPWTIGWFPMCRSFLVCQDVSAIKEKHESCQHCCFASRISPFWAVRQRYPASQNRHIYCSGLCEAAYQKRHTTVPTAFMHQYCKKCHHHCFPPHIVKSHIAQNGMASFKLMDSFSHAQKMWGRVFFWSWVSVECQVCHLCKLHVLFENCSWESTYCKKNSCNLQDKVSLKRSGQNNKMTTSVLWFNILFLNLECRPDLLQSVFGKWESLNTKCPTGKSRKHLNNWFGSATKLLTKYSDGITWIKLLFRGHPSLRESMQVFSSFLASRCSFWPRPVLLFCHRESVPAKPKLRTCRLMLCFLFFVLITGIVDTFFYSVFSGGDFQALTSQCSTAKGTSWFPQATKGTDRCTKLKLCRKQISDLKWQ